MNTQPSLGQADWLRDQVRRYSELRPAYEELAEALRKVLSGATALIAPTSMVQVRTKTVASFAEKALRKRSEYPDPFQMFTDLCGARVIARTQGEVAKLCEAIQAHFLVDVARSDNASARLHETEFGYRSIHYIVGLLPDVDYGPSVEPAPRGLWAEVQVRTTTEHAYSDFAHDHTYKGAFELPAAWRRELAAAAATLEEVDATFTRIEEGLRDYESAFGRFLTREAADTEMVRLGTVLELVPHDPELAARAAHLALAVGDWNTVVTLLAPFGRGDLRTLPHPILRDLGIALTKRGNSNRESDDFVRGQGYLELASSSNDVDAVCAFAGTWKGVDDKKALSLYRRAFELDPTNPYPLGNYLDLELVQNPETLRSIRPLLQGAAVRCRRHILAGINLPWAYFDLGRFALLLDEPNEALLAYARGSALTTARFMITTTVDSLDRLSEARLRVRGLVEARRLLQLVGETRFPEQTASFQAPPPRTVLAVVAVAAGPRSDPGGRAERVVDEAVADLTVSHTLGAPHSTQEETSATGLQGPADLEVEALQVRQDLEWWERLLHTGTAAGSVRVIASASDPDSRLAYEIAGALGAVVGLVHGGSDEPAYGERAIGGPAATDPVVLPADSETVRAFLAPASCDDPALLEALGESIHQASLAERRGLGDVDLSFASWDALPEEYRDSSRGQAAAIRDHLSRIGCAVAPLGDGAPAMELSDGDVEALAEMEHGRWCAERALAGWRATETRDRERMGSPDLAPWADLSEASREIDRAMVRRIPQLLRSQGLEMRRVK